ncbi:hypothetical protein IHE55_00605 [Streptomyces pactum]|uniref:Uncharacterized protein n=1 Tax=Streptomyces pactum TaxID=68249 RepID=A0ABS0NDV7_9ACTN|nr:hypothetical protein [Streptomyces pactum]MBH5333381.1 hypothetical protein [Streptomyces pactum]
MTENAYTFLPWLRSGLTTRISGDPGTAQRAAVPVELTVTGEALDGTPLTGTVKKDVQLYGPGDVVGVGDRAISRREPRPGTTNVEPNYLAHIEFYDEVFPWRYSPAPHGGGRLMPWLALIVLAGRTDPAGEPAEFEEGPAGGGPLPYITVRRPDALPPHDQLGAWAHVHVDGSLDTAVAQDLDGSGDAVLHRLADVLRTDPDRACARLMCPRHLRQNQAYDAFLVPVFETGRLAGLGLDPRRAPRALQPAWGQGSGYPGRDAEDRLPYYHRWSFTTGATGDFEYLVRLLEPRRPDPRVGRRDIDVHRPAGPGLPGITTPEPIGGVLRLGGALQVPEPPLDDWENWDNWYGRPPPAAPYPHPFQQALAKLVNLAEAYQRQTPEEAHLALPAGQAGTLASGVDPVITPPLYGRWHAMTSQLLVDGDGDPLPEPANRNWVHRLNLDPRYRVAAGFGTQVVQERQEEFMDAAWAQIGDVLQANARIRAAQLAREVGHRIQAKHLTPRPAPATTPAAEPAPSGKYLTLTAPAHGRVTALVAAAAGTATAERLAVGHWVAASQVSAAPLSATMRRITRPGARLMRSLKFPADKPRHALVPRMDGALGGVTAAPPRTRPAALITPARLHRELHPVIGVQPAATGTNPVPTLPMSRDFVLKELGDPVTPSTGGTVDSPEAQRFKGALGELYEGWEIAATVGQPPRPRPPLGVTGTTGAVLDRLRADSTVPRSLLRSVTLPERLRGFAEKFVEAMAYPVFDLPMYRSLLDRSVDVFVPNLHLIPANSITLLENNRRFIEAFLVGLNHEMAREMLWREYPTDQRGSPFRQFWDPRAALSPPHETAERRRERLRDITPVHQWGPTALLGQNGNRRRPAAPGVPAKEDLVLVIRGELLKKYPNAAVYAHKAAWPLDRHGNPVTTGERVLAPLPDENHPTADLVRLPLYEATVEPDIHLLGFDLDAAEARGRPPGDLGWFFVIKERPGEPRFGADDTDGTPPPVEVWNDLTWQHIDPNRLGFIRFADTVRVPLVPLDGSEDDQEKLEQRGEDDGLPLWHADLSSADIAYILFQAPVLVAVHAQEMLPVWPRTT